MIGASEVTGVSTGSYKKPSMVRVPADAVASPNGTYKKLDCPLLVYNDLTKKWTVEGGTEEDNAKLSAKYDPTLISRAKEHEVTADVVDWQDVYREYTEDGRLIGDLPKNCFFSEDYPESIYKIANAMSETLKGFYNGQKTIEDVTASFESTVRNIKDLLYEHCLTNGKNPEDNKKIIQDTLFEFRKGVVAFAVNACYEEGERRFGYDGIGQGAYYNSDYSNLSNQALDAMEKAALALSETLPSDSIDLNRWKMINPSTNELYSSFNDRWSWANGMNAGCVELTGKVDPPAGFQFYFQQRAEQSTITFEWGGKTKTVSVPINDHTGENKFTLSSLFQFNPPQNNFETQVNQFLSNVRIYSYLGYVQSHKYDLNARC